MNHSTFHYQKGKSFSQILLSLDRELTIGGNEMSMKQIFLNLSSEEALRMTMILLDEDKDEALKFLKEVLKPQVDKAARGGLNPFPSKLRLS